MLVKITGEPRLSDREQREAGEEPCRGEDRHRVGPAPTRPGAGLAERGRDRVRQERAPGEEAEKQDGDVEEEGPPGAGHGPEDAPQRLAAGPRRVVPAVEPEHGGVPGRGDEQEQREAAEGPRLPPRLPEAARDVNGKPGLHAIQGLGAGFIPANLDRGLIDEIVTVSDVAAERSARRLAQAEGLLVGPSAGANVHVACAVAQRLTSGNVVTILCDSGERYLF